MSVSQSTRDYAWLIQIVEHPMPTEMVNNVSYRQRELIAARSLNERTQPLKEQPTSLRRS